MDAAEALSRPVAPNEPTSAGQIRLVARRNENQELGYIPFEQDAANLFFQLVSGRYEHASLILTSNPPFAKAHLLARTCA